MKTTLGVIFLPCLVIIGLANATSNLVPLPEPYPAQGDQTSPQGERFDFGGKMKLIPLSRGLFAQVDDADFDFLNQWRWSIGVTPLGTMYAQRIQYLKGDTKLNRKKLHLKMHRLIMQTPKGMETDHIDNNSLNNQRHNLRVCTSVQNMMNRGPTSVNTTGYKGVAWKKREKMYWASIRGNGKRISLGYFKEKIPAALAYNEAAKKYHGEFAWLNPIESDAFIESNRAEAQTKEPI